MKTFKAFKTEFDRCFPTWRTFFPPSKATFNCVKASFRSSSISKPSKPIWRWITTRLKARWAIESTRSSRNSRRFRGNGCSSGFWRRNEEKKRRNESNWSWNCDRCRTNSQRTRGESKKRIWQFSNWWNESIRRLQVGEKEKRRVRDRIGGLQWTIESE